jgi:hypothetical protein
MVKLFLLPNTLANLVSPEPDSALGGDFIIVDPRHSG